MYIFVVLCAVIKFSWASLCVTLVLIKRKQSSCHRPFATWGGDYNSSLASFLTSWSSPPAEVMCFSTKDLRSPRSRLPLYSSTCAITKINFFLQVLRIRISMFLHLLDPDPDPLVRGTDPPPDPSITKQNSKEKPQFLLVCYFVITLYLRKMM